ncbi:MAG: hypothetical protein OHK0029_22040 [Armatimonadaceae bacterium]
MRMHRGTLEASWTDFVLLFDVSLIFLPSLVAPVLYGIPHPVMRQWGRWAQQVVAGGLYLFLVWVLYECIRSGDGMDMIAASWQSIGMLAVWIGIATVAVRAYR